MKKKKIFAFVVASVLLIGVFVVYSSFAGNPFMKIINWFYINQYVQENYSDLDYRLGFVKYNFIGEEYLCKVDVKGSVDEDFEVEINRDHIISDNHKWAVETHHNAHDRIWNTIRKDQREEFDQAARDVYGEHLEYVTYNIDHVWPIHLKNDITLEEFLENYSVDVEVTLKRSSKDQAVIDDKHREMIIQKYKEKGMTIHDLNIVFFFK